MPRLIAAFLRHGNYQQRPDTPSALQPYALNSEGHKQAAQGAAMLLDYCQQESLNLYRIISSSPLLRAWQTASELSTRLQHESTPALTVKTYDALCERSVGSVANLTIMEIESLLANDPRFTTPPKNWKSDSHYCLPFPGAESLMDSGQRVAQHILQSLSQLRSEITQDTIKIFIGHGASFRHAAYYLQILESHRIRQLSMFHAQPLFFEFSQDQHLQHIAGQWKTRANHKTIY